MIQRGFEDDGSEVIKYDSIPTKIIAPAAAPGMQAMTIGRTNTGSGILWANPKAAATTTAGIKIRANTPIAVVHRADRRNSVYASGPRRNCVTEVACLR